MTAAIIQSHLTDLFLTAKHLSATRARFANAGLVRSFIKNTKEKREENQWKLESAPEVKCNSVLSRKEINEKTETVVV